MEKPLGCVSGEGVCNWGVPGESFYTGMCQRAVPGDLAVKVSLGVLHTTGEEKPLPLGPYKIRVPLTEL